MSYSTEIKNEITTLNNSNKEIISILAGFIRNNGYIKDNDLFLTTENDNIANMLIKSIENIYRIKIAITKIDNLNLFKNKLNLIKISDKVNFILKDIGYFNNDLIYQDIPPGTLTNSDLKIRAYLRGVFLATGSINDPTSSYHLELKINNKNEAVFVQKLLNIFELNAKILNRDKGYMIYIKEAEKICDFLKIVKASKSVLHYENVRIYHEEKNKTNRLNNCEQANVDKIFVTANKQLEYIRLLEENLSEELLDDKLKEAMIYRKKYPEVSLKELSEIISLETGKNITKSGLNHRLRKIKELAEKIKTE